MIRIRNWAKFQHYKYRNPPWIKLYRELLNDPDWFELSGDTAKGLIGLWLIASEGDGVLPDSRTLAFRLHISENRLIALLSDCSKWLEDDASMMLASCKHDAIPEYRDRVQSTEEENIKTNIKSIKTFPPTKPVGVISPEFQSFWEQYPRKVCKQDAAKAWAKKGCEGKLGQILESLKAWKDVEWKNREMETIPHAATWINGARWAEIPSRNGTGKSLEQKRIELEAKYAGNVIRR